MNLFEHPTIAEFFNDRLIISWKLKKSSTKACLENILIEISAEPPLTFSPLQNQKMKLPMLDDSVVYVNWIINKPEKYTIIKLKFSSDELQEEHILTFSPD